MSGRLLDTTVLIDLVFDRSEALSRRFSEALAANDTLSISVVSIYEYRFGAERSRRRVSQLEALDRFLSVAAVLDFDIADATRAALVRGELADRGTPIGSYDLLIGGQALARDLTLVTSNTREFGRIVGLNLEDWRVS